MLLDTRQSLETPEGALLPLTPAGFGVRVLAQLLDILIRYGIVTVIFIALSLLGRMGTGIALILAFLLEWFYPVFFEVTRQGRTPGKKWMGIRVVNDDGTPITFGPSLLRNLLRFVDFLPMLYLTGIVASLCNRQFKRLGDLAAGSMVIYEAPPAREPSFEVRGQLPVPADFSTDEQRALLAFAERSKYLSAERQSELATILLPVIGSKDPVIAIKQMANTMVGKQ
ncbi:RDD family protein [Cellvibrio fibrivorans]|uniref:RDD family membrane protein YckC n=1 Tax=Cellvibrio fibrivorans TaxID=126350 RepID=A0ABU1USC2_9GAMM|nr:RDD family protein [Cellvibrio fibrivorans]MDR7088083.1 putative RDD family membrane protein YckC [Cellvibrio fibrivorans]